jgi:uridine kinase
LLFSRINRLLEQKERIIIAIDGNSAAGKTGLAQQLKEVYDGNVFSMDDFFLRPWQRTPERLSEAGGNVDYDRFLQEVINPLLGGLPFFYRPYDCTTESLKEPVAVAVRRLNFVVGVYSLHPSFSDVYDLKVFLEISPKEQRRRILLRNGPGLYDRFVREWIPMEQLYFEKFEIKQQCDLCFNME